MRAAEFETSLIEGHKGVTVVLVPFDPESVWALKPVRLAGRRHGWPVKARVGKTAFLGYVGERWGNFFVIVEPAVREKAKLKVGARLSVALSPDASAAALAAATEQSKATTQPKK